jgi:urocanate hydratase
MLLNSIEIAERPQDLLLSGASGRAAADVSSLQAILAALRRLGNDETLSMHSGKLAGVSHSTPSDPRIVATNGKGDAIFGDWLYAGTQTALPALYEIYADAAQRYFGGTLAGKLVVGGGLGGAGGAQPLAATLHGAAFLGIDVDPERIKRRVKTGYCEVMVNHLDEALRMLKNAVRQRKAASVGLIGDCSELFPELARRGIVPDLLTDYSPGPHSSAHTQGINDLQRLGTRAVPLTLWPESVPASDDWRLATWIALSGERSDIARVDQLALNLFDDDERIQRWLSLVAKFVRFQGLPARVAWIKQRHVAQFGQAINDLVARGLTSAPVLLGWHSAEPSPSPTRAAWSWAAPETRASAPKKPRSAQAVVADGTPDTAEWFASWAGA